MKAIYCDVCKKAIENPIPTRNYFQIADIDICEPCKDDLEAALKFTLRQKAPFNYDWHDETVLKLLKDGIQRGRIDTKVKQR